jgi:hypothetical protein
MCIYLFDGCDVNNDVDSLQDEAPESGDYSGICICDGIFGEYLWTDYGHSYGNWAVDFAVFVDRRISVGEWIYGSGRISDQYTVQ